MSTKQENEEKNQQWSYKGKSDQPFQYVCLKLVILFPLVVLYSVSLSSDSPFTFPITQTSSEVEEMRKGLSTALILLLDPGHLRMNMWLTAESEATQRHRFLLLQAYKLPMNIIRSVISCLPFVFVTLLNVPWRKGKVHWDLFRLNHVQVSCTDMGLIRISLISFTVPVNT